MAKSEIPVVRNTHKTIQGIEDKEILYASKCAMTVWRALNTNIESGFILVCLNDDPTKNDVTEWISFESVPKFVKDIGININGIKSRTGGGMLNLCIYNAFGHVACRIRPTQSTQEA